ncbi:cytidine deaminase [Candidatus Gottesmanbacteria bacterium RBG_13_37_7]|uniref:Cytidine deaminase n=1 Tax=Candidatus Gottesmanbacteria bacterium RBG_13_37_7 TaxID=1798369 RepID=A0A1F5YJT2_9BACT|nr:MAG: cytidine deaminase [Candidatus Gottesmanbacteria bacterium RBG_13_37_7]
MAFHQVRHEITHDVFESAEKLPEKEKELLDTARRVMENAYSPYSRFKVGAAIRLRDGTIVEGVNVENASYPVGICAERTAAAQVATLGKQGEIEAIAIMATGRDFDTDEPVAPCGACRQFLKEFEDLGGEPITIILSGKHGEVHRYQGIANLLPQGFGPKDLNM